VAKFVLPSASLLLTAICTSTGHARAPAAPPAPSAAMCAPAGPSEPDRVRLETIRRDGDRYVAELESGVSAELTLDARLQAATEDLLQKLHTPYGASVVLSIPDGKVLALAGRSSLDASLGPSELALRPWAPAASVFKLVSAAALIDEAGLNAETTTCYHGGVSAVLPDNLIDNPRIDRCASLAYGIGRSQNAILAKLAVRYLAPAQLARTGRALGFEETLAFDLPVVPSHLDVPERNPLEFARAAAGFWHSTLSPLHGALLAAAIADGGRMVTPRLIERTRQDAGPSVAQPPPPPPRQVLSPNAAAEVASMMASVTLTGTARTAFHDRSGRPRLSISAAGKTGTLFAQTDRGSIGYSWFVGFAPVEHPTVAFAVALGNRPGHGLRAAEVARRLLAEYAAEAGATPAPAPRHALRRNARAVRVLTRLGGAPAPPAGG
jgi:penicillin-binding protein A